MRPGLVYLSLFVCVGGCGPHRVNGGAERPRREIAVLRVIPSTGARLQAIDGRRAESVSQIQLTPGEHTLGVLYSHAKPADPQELTFTAEAGHFYELSAASPEIAGGRWTPVLVDNSTQTQIHPRK
jgi:hypothetical protein